MAANDNRRILYPALSLLIPCILGMISMINEGISIAIWIQNFIWILLGAIVCFFISKNRLKFNHKMMVMASIFLLGLTFCGPNIDGVHRWLSLPFFTLNASAIVIPITIVAFYRLIEEQQVVISLTGIIILAFLLCLQPDASQLLAFSLPMIVLILKANLSPVLKGGFSIILFLLTLQSWYCLDTLQPVNYTEGVLTMLHDLSDILYIVGIAALFGIPLYFLISCKKENRAICAGITMYYWSMICSTFMGNFPVPFMGYGVSPILGFYLFLIWFIHEEKNAFRRAP